MKYQGKIYLDERDYGKYVVDAEPHIMSRIRALFDTGLPLWEAGQYTHKPVLLPRTLAAAKDLLWIHSRYPIYLDPSCSEEIKGKANEYDRILAAVADVANDKGFDLSVGALALALPPHEYQIIFRNMARKVRRMLLADRMGLGKTVSGLLLFCEPEDRPGLVIAPPTICTQWERELGRFLPQARVHVIKGHKTYELPPADIYITAYSRLKPWQDVLVPLAPRTVILDEVQELRHTGTVKRELCKILSTQASMCTGLSGTPIYNYGDEMWSVMDVIAPGCLGTDKQFKSEWCDWHGKVREPAVLHSFLRSGGLFLRRTPEDVGLNFGQASKHVYTLDADLEQLSAVQDIMKQLAITMLSGVVGESDAAGRTFDHQLRHATGVAKARPAAEFIKLLLDEEQKVVLIGYHHDVYDIWHKELANFCPVHINGHDSPAQKDAAKKRFMEDPLCRVLTLSVRCAAGLDGLQYMAKTMVFGELDWSPHVMDQNVARLLRYGQKHHVQAFFLTVNDGADPFMLKVLNLKRSQHDGLIEGKEGDIEILDVPFDRGRVREMAAAYLRSIGEEVPVPVPETGLLAEVAAALRRVRLPTNTEAEMQEAIWFAMSKVGVLLPKDVKCEREVKVGPRSRLDFLATRGEERVAIECKVTATGRAEVYRQVRRYAEEANITALVLFAPWSGVSSFVVDKTPVVVVDPSLTAL